jgi:hypothetical protein
MLGNKPDVIVFLSAVRKISFDCFRFAPHLSVGFLSKSLNRITVVLLVSNSGGAGHASLS